MTAHDRQCRSTTGSGFTLIRLLVVIAILGVRAGLRTPGLTGAKAKGKLVRCLSGLRQMEVALPLYADGHAGKEVART